MCNARGWISALDRLPTSDDADVQGCVAGWHIYQGMMLVGWREAAKNRFIVYWRPTDDPPEGVKELRRAWNEEIEAMYCDCRADSQTDGQADRT